MEYSEELSSESFCEEVICFTMNEFRRLRGRSHEVPKETSPFFLNIGKASSLFGLLHQSRVRSTMKRVQHCFINSPYRFDVFLSSFTSNFFQDNELDSPTYFLIKILTFCGISAVMGDFCLQRRRIHLVQNCVENLLMELEINLKNDLSTLGGWEALYKVACQFASFMKHRFKTSRLPPVNAQQMIQN